MERLLEPTIRTEYPGSFLHLHPNVQLICDRDASLSVEGSCH